MKFLAALSLALCLFVVACNGVPVERETLLSIEKAQPVALVGAEGQPQQLRRVARHGFGFGGYGGYPIGGYGGYPIGGYGGYPIGGYGGYPIGGYGGYPIGGFGGSSSSAYASSSSGGFFG